MARRDTPSTTASTPIIDLGCEAAGLLGLVATLMLCMLTFAGAVGTVFWIAVVIAIVGTLIYLVHQVARRVTGASDLSWRQMVLITLAPAMALVMTLLVAGQQAGLLGLPVGHAPAPRQHVISVEQQPDGTLTTETDPADSSR